MIIYYLCANDREHTLPHLADLSSAINLFFAANRTRVVETFNTGTYITCACGDVYYIIIASVYLRICIYYIYRLKVWQLSRWRFITIYLHVYIYIIICRWRARGVHCAVCVCACRHVGRVRLNSCCAGESVEISNGAQSSSGT